MYLLDTHTLLWFLQNDSQISEKSRKIIEISDVCVSVTSLWETAIKHSLGKLVLPKPFNEIFPEQLWINDIDILGISIEHLHVVNKLKFIHRDPFDRIIIARALNQNLTLISKDTKFADYGVHILW